MFAVPVLILGLLLLLGAFTGSRVEEQRRGVIGSILLNPLHPATWHATAAILVGSWVELIMFTVVIGFFGSGLSLLFGGVGVVFIAIGIEVARRVARVERRRVAWVDPSKPLHPHPYRSHDGGPRSLFMAVFFDVNRWRDVAYTFVATPLVVLQLGTLAALWGGALFLLSLPAWAALGTLPSEVTQYDASTQAAIIVGGVIVGGVLVFAASSTARALMSLHRALVSFFLCTSQAEALERRVETLETSRKAVLDVEASELRRIERDLHDGAQQRLVLLSMNLGMAAEKIDSDPTAAKALVVDARDQARLALAEIRDLVRGIAPAILMDRGLVPALSALAARSPIPAVVVSELPPDERLSDATERAAYFVVAESLANVAKHSSATRCEVRCRLEGDLLVVEIWDDGAGGAQIVPGSGLAGLTGRVEALDGRLSISSPVGGPTVVRAELPLRIAGRFGVAGDATRTPEFTPPTWANGIWTGFKNATPGANGPVAGWTPPPPPSAPAPTPPGPQEPDRPV